ncbi:hypothetical protein [Herbidospora mongoliensis]|uniref:hypothetical protein n=1 Tax=Herbidospora mongoliensis TaxID=688067 RepID=UPI000AD44F72|nr:hypothetical protein [Herbidospora mongoliensis]
MIARLIAVIIHEIREELRALEDKPDHPEHIQVTTLETEPADQDEANELRSGFTT